MSFETTLVLIKPDAIQRNLSGKIINRIENTGLKIVGLKMIKIDKKLAKKHYQEHQEKPFFENLVDFISSSPVLAIAISGPNSIQKIRTLMGQTKPLDSPPGTISGDYGIDLERNLIHGSANDSDALRELELFFDKKEIQNFKKSIDERTVSSLYPKIIKSFIEIYGIEFGTASFLSIHQFYVSPPFSFACVNSTFPLRFRKYIHLFFLTYYLTYYAVLPTYTRTNSTKNAMHKNILKYVVYSFIYLEIT